MTKREIDRQISEYEDGGLTRTNARDLSALYIIRDNLFPDAPATATPDRAALPLSASFAGAPDVVPEYGDTDFYRAIAGKDPARAWGVMAELMDTLSAVHARLYGRVLTELGNL